MQGVGASLWLLDAATHELMLFGAVGLLIGGIDDLAIDLIWMVRAGWRRITIYHRHEPVHARTLAAPDNPGRIALFIGAWDESAVIGDMLRTALGRFDHDDYRIYVGVYPNDPATIEAVDAVACDDDRVRMVSGVLPGPCDRTIITVKKRMRDRAGYSGTYRAEVAEIGRFRGSWAARGVAAGFLGVFARSGDARALQR